MKPDVKVESVGQLTVKGIVEIFPLRFRPEPVFHIFIFKYDLIPVILLKAVVVGQIICKARRFSKSDVCWDIIAFQLIPQPHNASGIAFSLVNAEPVKDIYTIPQLNHQNRSQQASQNTFFLGKVQQSN